MRALTSLSTIFALTLGLTACGDNGSTTDATSNAPTTDEPGTTSGTTTNTPTTDNGTTTNTPTTDDGTSTGNLTGLTTTTGSTTDEPTVGTTSTTDATTSGTTADTTVGTTEGSDTTAADTTNTTGDVDTTTGGVGDPNWPAPDFMNMDMPCPPDFADAPFVLGGLVCSPECGAMDVCPDGATGDAQAACVFNPTSSGMPCMMGDTCDDATEECVQTGGGGMACLAPSDHCVLLCTGGETCPDGMECFDDLICQYPTP